MGNTNNNLTEEQRETFNKYFITDKEYHFARQDPSNISVAFFDFEVYRDTDVVLEIKVKQTCITMYKKVHLLSIIIL